MSRAHELLPIPPDSERFAVMPGMQLTSRHLQALRIDEHRIRSTPPAPDVRVLIYRPNSATTALPLVVHAHGGAFTLLRPESVAALDADIALAGSVVVSVDYRLAPEHRFPAAVEDCYTALTWAVKALDIDPDRVLVHGGSAGAAITAGLALMCRDFGGPPIAYQALWIPALDDRLATESMRTAPDDEGELNQRIMEGAWLHYLGEDNDRTTTSEYAAPARATTLAGLPPAFIQVHSRDPLRDEGLEYARRLMAAGVPVELYCAPGLHHSMYVPRLLDAIRAAIAPPGAQNDEEGRGRAGSA